MITTNQVNAHYKKNKRRTREEYSEIVKIQRKEEEDIISHEHSCDTTIFAEIDQKKLGNLIETEYDNPIIMKKGSCVMEDIFGSFYSLDIPDGKNSVSEAMADFVENGTQIGQPSVSGYASKFDIKESGISIIVKSPRYAEDYQDFVHELFVARHGTNAARKDIPNFAYVYGGFKCGAPSFDVDKKIINYCDPDTEEKNKVNYIIYEYIDGPSASDFLKTATVDEYISMILQVAFATGYGYHKFDWTHYDLHTENVIMKKLSKKSEIIYKGSNDDEYNTIKTSYVATIIDYGRSHIKYKDKSYGYNMPNGNIFPDQSFPLQDIYKFLMFSVEDIIRHKNYKLIPTAQQFFSYFSNEDVKKAALGQRDAYYSLPRELTEDMEVFEFIEHFVNNSNTNVIKFKTKKELGDNIEVLGCSDNHCAPLRKINQDIKTSIVANSYLDYYDKKVTLEKHNKEYEIKQLIQSLEYNKEKFCEEYTNKLNEFINKFNKLVKNIKNTKNQYDLSPRNILQYEPLVRKKEADLNKLKFLYHRIKRYLLIGKTVENDIGYQCSDINDKIEQQLEQAVIVNKLIEKYNFSYINIKNYIEKISRKEKDLLNDTDRNSFDWYNNFMKVIPLIKI